MKAFLQQITWRGYHPVFHRLAVAALLFICVFVIYSYFVPLVPLASFSGQEQSIELEKVQEEAKPSDFAISNNSSSRTTTRNRNSSSSSSENQNSSFVNISETSVIFRNAPWKSRIGQWLSQCYSNASSFPLIEDISNKACPLNCSRQGVCNRADGQCRCFHGYSGPGCEEILNLECNQEQSDDWPYGPWIVSICAAHCDKRRAMCFCGSNTKYPDRPAAEACGFTLSGTLVDWSKPDLDNIFTNDSAKHGWCNVDPDDGYNKNKNFKEQCDCKYDCTAGRFCETVTECVCLNQCSGNGICRGGFCQCSEGWYGIDCSIPSSEATPLTWPKWLESHENESLSSNGSASFEDRSTSIVKKRPLIFIYDLPPEFNSHLLEGRHWKYECVNRIYDANNVTIWTEQLYGAEIALYESLLASPHRTTNANEADFFYVPVLGACLITRADDAPHLSMKNFMGLRSYITLDLYRRAYNHISQNYPYWNRTAGRDHIWFFSWDEGACFAPKEIWNSMMLVHWGNTNSKHNYSTTGYYPDNWDRIPLSERGSHPCFDPAKDLVMPAWKIPDGGLILQRLWKRSPRKRKTLFYFNGNLGNAYEHGRPEPSYSMGIRQKLAKEFGSSPDKNGELGRQAAKDVIVTNVRSYKYSHELASSKFCGVLPGDGWSGRMEDSILHGCIPVVIQDGIKLIYENFLEYDNFAVRIKEDDIPELVNTLRAISDTEVEAKLSAIRKLWQRFLYRDAIILEAQRQQQKYNRTSDWAKAFSTLVEDDAFSTLIQVLHYKLYNDPWRQEYMNQSKLSNLPEACQFVNN